MITRKALSKDLAQKVEFASDRTCCICRIPGKRIQIAHIDDNPANNDFDNLAVLCLECHDEAHRKGGLARSLTPGVVKLYNQSWRELVRIRLLPQDDFRKLCEYQHEVMLEISLVCQEWAHTYLTHTKGTMIFLEPKENQTLSYLEKNCSYTHSKGTWERLHPLANEFLKPTVDRLEKILLLHSQVIPVGMKTQLLRNLRWLSNFPTTYNFMFMGGELVRGLDPEGEEPVITFKGVFQALRILDDEARQVRDSTAVSGSSQG
jgi:hypothetical protein